MVNIRKGQVLSFVPNHLKILDIQNNDTNTRVCSLAGLIPSNAVAIVLHPRRASGSGALKVFPNSGNVDIQVSTAGVCVYGFAEGTQDLKLANTINNDDWDIWEIGSFIEGPAGS